MYNTIMIKVSYNHKIYEKINNIPSHNFNAATIRYLATSGMYVIRGYLESLGEVGDVKVSEYDLIATLYNEKGSVIDLDDDSFNDIQVLQYMFKLSPTIMKEAQRKWKRKRLGRCFDSVVSLEARSHTKGETQLTQNLENYEVIYQTCVNKDRLEEFLELNREWCRYNKVKFNRSEWVKKFKEERAKTY